MADTRYSNNVCDALVSFSFVVGLVVAANVSADFLSLLVQATVGLLEPWLRRKSGNESIVLGSPDGHGNRVWRL